MRQRERPNPHPSTERGELHGYVCGVTTTGAAYCWGYNADGELGNGATTNSATPVAVSGGLKFTMVSGSCGLTLGGAAYCWGGGNLTPLPVFDRARLAVVGRVRTAARELRQ